MYFKMYQKNKLANNYEAKIDKRKRELKQQQLQQKNISDIKRFSSFQLKFLMNNRFNDVLTQMGPV